MGPFEQLEPSQAHQKDPPPLSFAPFSRILWKSDAKSPVSLFRMTGLLVAPAGVEPTMGESKSPALPLGDGASCKILYHILCFSTRGRFHFSAFAAALCRLLQPAICEKPIFHHNNRIRPFCCAFVTLYVVNIGLNKPPLPGFSSTASWRGHRGLFWCFRSRQAPHPNSSGKRGVI